MTIVVVFLKEEFYSEGITRDSTILQVALKSTFHPCFSLVSGTSHMDYNRQENRALFMALFRWVVTFTK